MVELHYVKMVKLHQFMTGFIYKHRKVMNTLTFKSVNPV